MKLSPPARGTGTLRPMFSLSRVLAVVAIAACGSTATPKPSPTPSPAPTPQPGSLYELDHLLTIEFTVAPADWDKARNEHHPPDQVFGKDCLAGPAKRPYSYVPAKLSIDGGAPIAVEIRKKGFLGSVNDTRPSLKVRFSEPHRGVTRLTLNNNQQDASQVHQCVAYRAFARAGVHAPRCSLAVVSVNGDSLGVYSNVESIKKPFLARVFGDDSGDLYEGNLSDFRPEWINTLQQKSDPATPDRAAPDAVVAALTRPDGELVAALEPVVDLDGFFTFWAMERLIGQWDGYTNNQNNFYLYRSPTDDRLHFIPWGADSVLGDPDMLSRYTAPESVYATSVLPHRLYAIPAMRERYVARVRELLEIWDADAMLAEIATLETLARPHLHVSGSAFDAGLAKVRGFISGRRKAIEADLASGAPDWKTGLRSSPCATTGGAVTATFETTWSRTQPMNPLGVGKVSLDITMAGTKMEFGAVGVTANASEQTRHQPTIGLFGVRNDGVLIMTFVVINPARFQPGSSVQLDGFTVSGIMLEMNLGTGTVKLTGFLGEGTLELTKTGTNDGDPVEGTLSAPITHPKYWLD